MPGFTCVAPSSASGSIDVTGEAASAERDGSNSLVTAVIPPLNSALKLDAKLRFGLKFERLSLKGVDVTCWPKNADLSNH